MNLSKAFGWLVLVFVVLGSVGCAGEDPVYRRCVTERETYCERLYVCVQLGTLVGVTVNFEDESDCRTKERTRCDQVSEENACPGESNASYDSAKHEQCIKDQDTQSCSAFASRPSSCESYCTTTQQ